MISRRTVSTAALSGNARTESERVSIADRLSSSAQCGQSGRSARAFAILPRRGDASCFSPPSGQMRERRRSARSHARTSRECAARADQYRARARACMEPPLLGEPAAAKSIRRRLKLERPLLEMTWLKLVELNLNRARQQPLRDLDLRATPWRARVG